MPSIPTAGISYNSNDFEYVQQLAELFRQEGIVAVEYRTTAQYSDKLRDVLKHVVSQPVVIALLSSYGIGTTQALEHELIKERRNRTAEQKNPYVVIVFKDGEYDRSLIPESLSEFVCYNPRRVSITDPELRKVVAVVHRYGVALNASKEKHESVESESEYPPKNIDVSLNNVTAGKDVNVVINNEN